jgi:hypothetical protein
MAFFLSEKEKYERKKKRIFHLLPDEIDFYFISTSFFSLNQT